MPTQLDHDGEKLFEMGLAFSISDGIEKVKESGSIASYLRQLGWDNPEPSGSLEGAYSLLLSKSDESKIANSTDFLFSSATIRSL